MSEQFKKGVVEPDELVYDIGDAVDRIYFVYGGNVSLELHYLVQTSNSHPIGNNQISRDTQNYVVRRTMRTIGHGR